MLKVETCFFQNIYRPELSVDASLLFWINLKYSAEPEGTMDFIEFVLTFDPVYLPIVYASTVIESQNCQFTSFSIIFLIFFLFRVRNSKVCVM